MKVMENFAVIGLGEFGSRICEVIVEEGGSVIAFDNDAQAVERIKKIVPAAMVIDTTDEEALQKAPLEDIDTAIVAIGDSIQASILTTTLLKERGISLIIARAVSPLHETVLKRVGAGKVLNIEKEAATSIAKECVHRDVLRSLSVANSYSISEIKTPQFFAGQTLLQAALKEKFDLTVIAVVRLEIDIDAAGNSLSREVTYEPEGSLELQSGDILFVFGTNEKIAEFENM